MIVQAMLKGGRVKHSVSVPKPKKDKRFLVCTDNVEEKVNAYVFDIIDQKIVYRSSSTKSIEQVYEDIYSMYSRHDTRVVDPSSLRDVFNSLDLTTISQRSTDLKKVKEELAKPKILQETIHVKKIRDTYKYLDKYKVKLKAKIIKKSSSTTTVFLHDEEHGVAIGTHRLEYDYLKGIYEYWYVGNLVCKANDLETIFK